MRPRLRRAASHRRFCARRTQAPKIGRSALGLPRRHRRSCLHIPERAREGWFSGHFLGSESSRSSASTRRGHKKGAKIQSSGRPEEFEDTPYGIARRAGRLFDSEAFRRTSPADHRALFGGICNERLKGKHNRTRLIKTANSSRAKRRFPTTRRGPTAFDRRRSARRGGAPPRR